MPTGRRPQCRARPPRQTSKNAINEPEQMTFTHQMLLKDAATVHALLPCKLAHFEPVLDTDLLALCHAKL